MPNYFFLQIHVFNIVTSSEMIVLFLTVLFLPFQA